MLLAVTLVIMMFAPYVARGIGLSALPFIETPHLIRLDRGGQRRAFASVAFKLGLSLSVPFGFLMVAALIAGVIQNGPIFSFDFIQPKFEKISPVKGLKRLFSLKSIAEFVKGVLKLSIVGTVATVLMIPAFEQVELVSNLDADGLLMLLRDLAVRMLIGLSPS
jgi:flagellar biosynthetic protein FlhB